MLPSDGLPHPIHHSDHLKAHNTLITGKAFWEHSQAARDIHQLLNENILFSQQPIYETQLQGFKYDTQAH